MLSLLTFPDGSHQGFPGGSDGKESLAVQETLVQSLGPEDPLEEEIATHSSILAWEIPWTEEPGGVQSMRLQRDGHDGGINVLHCSPGADQLNQ